MEKGRSRNAITRVVLLAVFCGLPPTAFATVYVDLNAPVGTNDGSSWANACRTIQDGLDASSPGEEIWVASGTYAEAIVLGHGDVLYGGFEGYGGAEETLLSQRDWETNEVIVDASTADGGGPANHVVTMAGVTDARLDGFTITGGHADGVGQPDDSAAGIFAMSADNTNRIANCIVRDNVAEFGGGGIGGAYAQVPIQDCTITGNQAYNGAGVAWAYGALTITGCTVSANIAGQSGGGISGIECEEATITDCVVAANEAPEGGAGIGFFDTALTITGCQILDNVGSSDGPGGGVFLEAGIGGITLEMTDCMARGNEVIANPGGEDEGWGGGVYYVGGVSAILTDCTFRDNSAQDGGGLLIDAPGLALTLTRCTIDQNTATGYGGAALLNVDSAALTRCTIAQNTAMETGGMGLHAASGEIANCVISGNSATNMYGGLRLSSPSTPGISVVNCTISGNTAGTDRGGLVCATSIAIRNTLFEGNTGHAIYERYLSSDPTVENCLFYNNPDGAYYDQGGTPASYLDSEVDDLNTNVPEATGNITGDLSFVDAVAGDFHITGCSAAIDAGTAPAPAEDMDGASRPVDITGVGADGTGTEYDIGAYEVSSASPALFLSQPQGARLYSGDSHTFTVEVLDAGCGLSYQWKWDDGAKTIHDVGGDSPTLNLPDVTGMAGSYWCEILYGGGAYVSATATLEVEDLLSIDIPPVGGEYEPGQSHTFGVTVSGGYTPLTYTWKKDGDPVSTDPVYLINPLNESHSGWYTVEVEDDNGDLVESDPVELKVGAGVPVASVWALAALFGVCLLLGGRTVHWKGRRT